MSRAIVVFGASVLVGTALVYGCGDDSIVLSPKPDGGAPAIFNVSPPDAGSEAAPPGAPLPPPLGTMRDRAGRPLINTAMNHTFDPDAGARLLAEDGYNENIDAGSWSEYVPEIAKNLAIYDALDRVCGNQALAGTDAGSSVQRYGALAGLLADDRLWIDTSQSTCAQYLAVERQLQDCGGRPLGVDVIDATYNFAAAGFASTSFGDGVADDATKTGGATFPYLVAP